MGFDLNGTGGLITQPFGNESEAPGIVSPFGLLNNTAYNVQVYFDQDIVDEPIQTFHPNENTHTIFIKTPDLFKFLKAESYDPEIIDL